MAQFDPIAVVEMASFLAATRRLMNDEERDELVAYLAFNPTVGVVVPGTGGVRKMRWGLEGRGKRGGARVIYFFHDMDMPLYLLDAYAKNEKTDLSEAERNRLHYVTKQIVEAHKRERLRK
ncbi:MAG: type II toxin-antitoxin system RelE/ParE family toxin [Terracidiphilus sp.]